MIGLVPALLVAAALFVAPAGPGGRVTAASPKAPRDGPEKADPERCASDIELFAACVSAGLPAATAAAAVADTHGTRSPWHTVASLTALGVEPQRAWAEIRHLPGGEDLAGLVALSATSGTSLAAGCGRIAAQQLRAGAGDRAKAKAECAGVLIAIPLTAFFLPAFFVLGLAPAVISLGTSLIN